MVLEFIALAMFLAAQGQGDMPTREPVGRIEGHIIECETGAPVAGARVLVVGSLLGAVTDTSGWYCIADVPVGFHTLRVSSIELPDSIEAEVTVLHQSTTTRDFSVSDLIVCKVRAKPEFLEKFGGPNHTMISHSLPRARVIEVAEQPLRVAALLDLHVAPFFKPNGETRWTPISVILPSYEAFNPENGRQPDSPADLLLYPSDPEIGTLPFSRSSFFSDPDAWDPSFPTPLWNDCYYWEHPRKTQTL